MAISSSRSANEPPFFLSLLRPSGRIGMRSSTGYASLAACSMAASNDGRRGSALLPGRLPPLLRASRLPGRGLPLPLRGRRTGERRGDLAAVLPSPGQQSGERGDLRPGDSCPMMGDFARCGGGINSSSLARSASVRFEELRRNVAFGEDTAGVVSTSSSSGIV